MGKSTVASNLALVLAEAAAKVGLLDGDIYGPSVPTMFAVKDAKPEMTTQQSFLPVEALAACGESRSTSPILLAKGSTGSSAALTLWRMTMGTRDPEQPPLWIATSDLPVSPGHPFYTRLNALLDADSTRS